MKNLSKIFVTTLLLLPLLALAQAFLPQDELSLSFSPQEPRPGQNLSVSLSSRTVNLNSLFITWRKNGFVEREGLGQTKHTTIVGPPGDLTLINVRVVTNSGETLEVSKSVRPASLSLVWEADSYTPPFYKGKGLAAHESKVRIVAIPNIIDSSGKRLSTKELNYTWLVNGKEDREQSGFGKDVYTLKGSLVSKPKVITAMGKTRTGDISVRKTITVSFTDPEVNIYEENPLTGLRANTSARGGAVGETEVVLVAVPFFFSKEAVEGGVVGYQWKVDGQIRRGLNRNKVAFGSQEPGQSQISINVINPLVLLQEASRAIRISIQ